METATCPNCGASVPPESVFCLKCGTRLQAQQPAPAAPAPARVSASDYQKTTKPAQPAPQAARMPEPAPAPEPVQAAGPAYPASYPAAEQTTELASVAQPAPQVAPESALPAGWSSYEDSWNGFNIALPPGWQVTAGNGRIVVHEGAEFYSAALLWPFRLPAQTPLQQVAQQFVSLSSVNDPSFQAMQQQGQGSDATHMLLRTRSMLNGQQLEGLITVMVDGLNALISGFAAPSQLLAARTPIFARILSSFRPTQAIQKQPVQDQTEGAFTAQIPQGWNFNGGVNRASSASGAIQLTASRDQQGLVLAAVPVLTWMFMEGMDNMFGGFSGAPQNMPYMPAAQMASQFLPQYLSQYNQNMRVEGVEDRPDLAAQAAGQLRAGGIDPNSADCTVATLLTSYDEAGTRFLQKTQLSVYHPHPAQSFGYNMGSAWNASVNNYYRAPLAEFAKWEPILLGILSSVTMNPAWQQGQQQALNQYMLNAQQDQNQRYKQMAQTQRETFDIMQSAHANQVAAQDKVHHSFMNYLSDRQDMTDDQGAVYNVPTGHEQYWVDRTDSTVYGGSWGETTPDSDWRHLTPTGT